jgi:hypothetical protein
VSGGLDETPVFATTSDSGNGGASVVGAYQINTGLDTTVVGSGWGAGLGPAARGARLPTCWRRVLSFVFGATITLAKTCCLTSATVAFTIGTKPTAQALAALSCLSLAGANYTPTIAKQVLVSDRDRHVIAFGCDPQDNPGVQDPLLIRFSDQESLTQWESTRFDYGRGLAPRLGVRDCHCGRDAPTGYRLYGQLDVRHAVPWPSVYLWYPAYF